MWFGIWNKWKTCLNHYALIMTSQRTGPNNADDATQIRASPTPSYQDTKPLKSHRSTAINKHVAAERDSSTPLVPPANGHNLESQMHPLPVLITYSLNAHLNSILPPRSSK
jgi:hypothetical protein